MKHRSKGSGFYRLGRVVAKSDVKQGIPCSDVPANLTAILQIAADLSGDAGLRTRLPFVEPQHREAERQRLEKFVLAVERVCSGEIQNCERHFFGRRSPSEDR